MGITGLIPFIEKASRRVNVSEFNGCTVAIDSYCWLHKGAFACADKLVRGEETDVHIKYCLKYVTMLLSNNIKPILVFDGRHLPAKAQTEAKRRESRDISKKRAAELLSLGKIDEARSYMRRSVDITHSMALSLIKECRKRNVDCIVAPYEADAQLAYLNIKNIAHLVITEDSDLILFGCTKVLFKMDLDGTGTLVEAIKLPLVMKCPIEHYRFDKFRRMCIMSGCDYLPSLPGIGLAKARQFVTATHDSNFANTKARFIDRTLTLHSKDELTLRQYDKERELHKFTFINNFTCVLIKDIHENNFIPYMVGKMFGEALRKLPSFFNKMSLTVTDEYRENFLKAEATFKHQYVYDPIKREMVRLSEPNDEDTEKALCVNAGQLLEPKVAFQLALGNLDPFTLKKMDNWSPDDSNNCMEKVRTNNWKDKGVSTHPSIWQPQFTQHLDESSPWLKKVKKPEPIIAVPLTRPKKKVVNLVSKYVPETQDESLTIENLSNMYCLEPVSKKQKICDNESETYTQDVLNDACTETEIIKQMSPKKPKSPILQNKDRSFRKSMNDTTYSVLKRLSKFPRTEQDNDIVESKFFNSPKREENAIEESPERVSRNPFKLKSSIDTQCLEIPDSQEFIESPKSRRNPFKIQNNNDNDNCDDNEVEEFMNASESSQKENCETPVKNSRSPILDTSPNVKKVLRMKFDDDLVFQVNTEVSVIENTFPYENLVTPVDSQLSYGASASQPTSNSKMNSTQTFSQFRRGCDKPVTYKKSTCKVPGLKRTNSLPSNQPTLLSKFGFQKKQILKK